MVWRSPEQVKIPFFLRNGHLQSIFPSIFRKVKLEPDRTQRVDTPDGDFVDVDWYGDDADHRSVKKLLIISHGLEGHSRRPYVQGMARAALQRGWAVAAWSFRGCSGEPNRNLVTYHSGHTDDLRLVIQNAVELGYHSIALCGFSIGGNKTMLYLGREIAQKAPQVKAAVVLSVPFDLISTADKLALRSNRIYMRYFLTSFSEKFAQKAEAFPGQIDVSGFSKIRTFAEMDERYTAPLNGFASALDYWEKSSSLPWLGEVNVPSLLISAKDDPFLTPECFPSDKSIESDFLHFAYPQSGGHVGFMGVSNQPEYSGEYWSEQAALNFLDTKMAVD